jgi:hypothetical protein
MTPLTRRGTVKKSFPGTRMVEVVSADEPANEPITSFRQIEDEANAAARAIVRGVSPDRLRQFEDARERMTPDCGDKDEDCPGVEDKVHCWLYAPERGMCPYLRTEKDDAK